MLPAIAPQLTHAIEEITGASEQFTELTHDKDSYAQYVLGEIYANGEGTIGD